ncbi:pilus assembly protein PilP [Thioalkalivibrio denitrificans]|uniref:Pilus assembly protein PilP n=1 Tax=Thioalkalivibrio denitrificans TaxID=108003 RepID=A0A1V3NCR1_9GAMM|nr:pilus assembly protein PilP [Thioalkalivibrio denitrificans]
MADLRNTPMTRRRQLILLIAVVPLLTVGLSGCGQSMSDLEQYVEQTKARPGGRIEPMPEVITHEGFPYPGHTRDPFDSSILAPQIAADRPVATSTVTIDPDRPQEYLESYPLDTLRMVGTLEQGGTHWALIRTPDRTIQRVASGNYMGQNHGRITGIRETGVDLTEIVPDGFGGYMERDTSIALSE